MTVYKNFVVHLATIMDREGETLTKRRVTETMNTAGRVVGSLNSDISITGIVGAIPSDDKILSAGWVGHDDLVGLFNYSDDIQEHDIIIKDSQEFEVIKIVTIEDVSMQLANTAYLRRRAYEA